MKILNWLLGRTKLQARNDQLICQNRRLGLEILELRKMKIPKRKAVKADGRIRQVEIREESLAVRKYKMHVDSQRQNLIVRKLKKHVAPEVFKSICSEVAEMTDEQVAAT